MSAYPVNPSAMLAFLGSESTWGTPPAPNTLTLYELQSLVTGPGEGGYRRKQDRHAGRGMSNAVIQGRQPILPVSLRSAVKTRSAIDATPSEDPIYKACGLKRTTNASTSVVYSPSTDPLSSGDFAPMSVLRSLGHPDNGNGLQAEVLRAVLFNSLKLSGGDKEVTLEASGGCIGKYTQGGLDSITVNNVVTSLTITAAESYRLALGYYKCESEIIQVTACTPGGTSATIVRGALSSAAASHTAKALLPYAPAVSAPTVKPIAEATSTATLLGVSTRCSAWEFELSKTGMDFLPPETGSARVQGAKATRYEARGRATLVLKGDDVTLAGKADNGVLSTLSFVQGTGTGNIITIALANCRVLPFAVPDTYDDVAVVTVEFEANDSSGNDAFTITLT